MVLLFTSKITARLTYVSKHIFTRILGVEVSFTNSIDTFIAYEGAKLSYGKQPLGNELFIKSQGLLQQQGVESIDISVRPYKDTICFFQMKDAGLFPFDIFAASFYLLSRYEEYLPHVKDAQGRFSAKESLAYKNQFLKHPVVDIWSFELKKILQNQFPELRFDEKKSNAEILIDASQPYLYAQKGVFRGFVNTLQDLFSGKLSLISKRAKVISGIEKDPFDTYDTLITITKKSKTPVTFFFLTGASNNYYEGTNVNRKGFKLLVKHVADYKQIGLMISTAALFDYMLAKNEKQHLEAITNTRLDKSLQADTKLNLPDSYRNLVTLEIKNDYTMTYHNKIGFRASTCTPFLFYDLDYEIITPLVLQPVAVTTSALRLLKKEQVMPEVEAIKKQIENCGGSFISLFENSDFKSSKWSRIALQLIQNIA